MDGLSGEKKREGQLTSDILAANCASITLEVRLHSMAGERRRVTEDLMADGASESACNDTISHWSLVGKGYGISQNFSNGSPFRSGLFSSFLYNAADDELEAI